MKTIDFAPTAVTAFGRLKVSNAVDLFDAQQQYGDNTLVWETSTAGGGTVEHLPNESTVAMKTNSVVSGARVIRQSKQRFRYQPGKAQHVVVTFTAPVATTNVRWRAGYFDDRNGIFLQRSSSTVSLVLRSYVTGSAVDTVVNQASWSEDVMDGTGPSLITLDLSKIHINDIDLQWLGAGRVRVMFNIGGVAIPVHEFNAANSATSVYMTTANLPVRFELENVGTAGSVATFKQVCASVESDGGQDLSRAQSFGYSNGITSVACNSTGRPVLSIRAKTTMGTSSIRNDGMILPDSFDLLVGGQNVQYAIILNGTLTGASWVGVDSARSIAEADVSATSISGGTTVAVGYCASGAGATRSAARSDLLQNMSLVYASLLGTQDTLTLWARSTAGTADVLACCNWREVAW